VFTGGFNFKLWSMLDTALMIQSIGVTALVVVLEEPNIGGWPSGSPSSVPAGGSGHGNQCLHLWRRGMENIIESGQSPDHGHPVDAGITLQCRIGRPQSGATEIGSFDRAARTFTFLVLSLFLIGCRTTYEDWSRDWNKVFQGYMTGDAKTAKAALFAGRKTHREPWGEQVRDVELADCEPAEEARRDTAFELLAARAEQRCAGSELPPEADELVLVAAGPMQEQQRRRALAGHEDMLEAEVCRQRFGT